MKPSKSSKDDSSVTRAPEAGEPKDHMVQSTRRLEKTQYGSGGDKAKEKDDVRKAPESGR